MHTWLFAPGHEERKVRKAVASSADFVVLDWEDAVPDAERPEARRLTIEVLHELDEVARQRLCVRVNHPGSEWFPADLEALEGEEPAVVVVPKTEALSDIEAAAAFGRPLMLLIESALGVERVSQLARGHDLVRYLAFGPLDLLADLGGAFTTEGEETLYSRARVAVAARAAKLNAAIDGPWPRLRDLEGLEIDTRKARRMGYGGRLLIHPEQLEPVERAFAPTLQDVAFAREVLEAARVGVAEGRGALVVQGRFVDPPVIKWAQKVLARAEEA